MTLDGDELNETDQAIIDQLQQGRVTPQYLAKELDISRPYASDRLKRLLEHNHVERLAPGLYGLVEDPRER
ncbi:winged helix-turn-helix transcriptional regulator [Natrinema sp. H-ect4]|uniref:winged helix-turn-helix transcriptional regulator n=1 Tax=Natrinema sp. H-ect4 TaxID=3242699 RepID=UPI0035A8FDC9